MKIYLEYILILTLNFSIWTSSGLPPVTDTHVGKPDFLKQPCLTIFYDAMEGKSQAYFNTTLIKDLDFISSDANLNIIPCQQVKVNGKDLSCESKVDPSCKLDIIHSCAIAQVANKTQLVSFLGCTMSTVDKLTDFVPCATKNGIDDKQIQTCADSDTGKSLCITYNAHKISACNDIPLLIFKSPRDIKNDDPFEHMDYYTNDVCINDLPSAICAKLKTDKATSIPEECNKKLVLGIFYMAMEKSSQEWFQKFEPAYKKLSKCLTIKYEPCMFAKMTGDGKLDCQDINDYECVAAKTHACAVSIVKDTSLLSQFIICAMKVTEVSDFEKCATGPGIQYDPIQKCAKSDEGKNLCLAYSKSRPNWDSMPAFSYELTFDADISELTFTASDVVSAICQQMKQYSITCPECSTS